VNLRSLLRRILGPGPATPTLRPQSRPPAEAPAPRGLLAGQTAVIVGAGPNIGLGIATSLAREGARLLVTNTEPTDLDQVLRALVREHADVSGLQSDVTRAADSEALQAWLERSDWTPDVLVLNAGVHSRPGAPPLDEYARVFQVNVAGPLSLARQIAGRMTARGTPGAIIFISSVHQQLTHGDPIYSASKAALVMAMRELALDSAPAGLRVNAVAPGWVAADAHGLPVPHRRTPLYQTSTPPEAIGQAVVFLASRALSGHTTGAVLTVDGGASLVSYATPTPQALPPE
jgi:NAD(P)-dependent dehydrogenase (short-subunit alcohol dehydrogenase family)